MTAKIPSLSAVQGQRCRRSLLAFVERSTPGYQAGWVHHEICRRLEAFTAAIQRGERPRLLLTVPPRHGKSQVASRSYPAWYLGHHPDQEVMIVSYSAELANSFSYDARDIVLRDWYQQAFPAMRLEHDRKGITRWRTSRGGGLNPCGIGSSLTGSGCSLLILDDLFKSEQQAHSAAHRQMVHDRYRSSIYTRLAPFSGVIFLSTRWHDDDLAGRLIQASDDGTGDKWEVVSYPAIAIKDEEHRRKGEALHPDRFPVEALRQIEKVSGPSEWASLYQQDPLPEGGEFLQRAWIKWYEPMDIKSRDWTWDHVVISVDSSYKTKVTNDRTATQIWGKKGGDLYLIDAWAGRLDFGGLCDHVAALCGQWSIDTMNAKRVEVVIESRANGPALIRYLQAVEGITNLRPFDPQRLGGKEVRANIASAWFRSGRVYLPTEDMRLRPQITEALGEWLRFPTGKHDDCVDAMSMAVCHLRRFKAASATIGPVRKGPRPQKVW